MLKGLQTHFSGTDAGALRGSAHMRALAEIGVQVGRIDGQTSPIGLVLDQISETEAAGIKAYVIVSTPEMVASMPRSVFGVEYLNEPDGRIHPDTYMSIFREIVNAAASAGITPFGPAISNLITTPGILPVSDLKDHRGITYLNQMGFQDLPLLVKGSFHRYGRSNIVDQSNPGFSSRDREVEWARAAIGFDREWVISEFGWPTVDLSEEEAAIRIQWEWDFWARQEKCLCAMLYQDFDGSGDDERFGLHRIDGSVKVAIANTFKGTIPMPDDIEVDLPSLPSRKIALWAASECPVTFEDGGGIDARVSDRHAVTANRETPVGTWETLTEFAHGNGYVSLARLSHDGPFFLTAENGGGGRVSTNRRTIGNEERFRKIGGGYQTFDEKHYLCCEIDNPDKEINATREWIRSWETFREEPFDVEVQPGEFPLEAGRLHRDGTLLRDDTNGLWTARGYSMFLAFLRMLRGEDIRPDLRTLRNFGFNCIRVFGPLPWKETPDYRFENFLAQRLPEFFELCASEAMRVEFTPICYGGHELAANVRTFSLENQRLLLGKTYDAAAPFWNVMVEVANEPHVNRTNPIAIANGIDRRGVLSATGEYDNKTLGKKFAQFNDGYMVLHSDRSKTDWPRKARHAEEAKKANKIPVILDEPRGAGEPNVTYPSARDSKIAHFVWYHALAAFWTSGSTLHSEEGKWGRVPTPGMRQYEIIEAVSRDVFKKIDATWQVGKYSGSHYKTSPVDFIRDVWTYSTINGNRAISVRCSDEVGPPKAINGWREVERWGPSGTLILTER